MFETLFQYPAVVTRQRSGPFAEARERFLNHCARQPRFGSRDLGTARSRAIGYR